MTKGELAKEYFTSGYNCSQAVALAFCDEMEMPAATASRLTVGFGGGVGRMREVCGAVSGMTFVISALYDEEKTEIYKRIQTVADSFREQNGSIVCRELLGLSQGENSGPVAEARTPEFYKKRPCGEIVRSAADILEDYISENPYKK